jgi:WD40 repeat protein
MLTPDKDPFESLYRSLPGHFKQQEAQVARVVKPDTLSQVVKLLKPAEAYWLIFIDQFEELFMVSEAEKRDCFIHALANLSEAHADDPKLRIVATMRSDFLDQLDPAPANRIARLTDQHRPLLTQMQPDELRRAIEQPAAQHGVSFEAGLVEEIIAQVQGQAGGLPLLQYTLDLLWESEVSDGGIHDRELNQASYRALGGVQGALRQRVDEIYNSLSPVKQVAAQRIFLRLVEIGGDAAADWRPVRRRAERAAFSGEQEEAVLALLIKERLLVSDAPVAGVGPGPAGGQGATVEIAHEILLTSWDQLKGWIEQNREDIALRNRLNDDVRQWKTEQPDDELWSGTKLGRVVELKDKPACDRVLGDFSPEEQAFIEASVGRRDRLEQEKEAQRQRELEQERKARKVAQRITVGASLAGVAMAGLGVFSTLQVRQAQIEQIRTSVTLSQAQLANNQTLDATVESIRAEVLLRKSFWLRVRPNSEVKTEVLGQLLQMANIGQERNRWEGVNSVDFSPDTQLATAGDDGTARLWDSAGKPLAELKGHQGRVYRVVFSPDGTRLATSGEDNTARLWDSAGNQLAELKGHQGTVWRVVFSPDGTKLATSEEDGTARVWDTTGKQLAEFKGHQGHVISLVFSPDGTKLATGGEDGTVRLWDSAGKPLAVLKGHKKFVNNVVFSPDGTKLATRGDDGTARLWDTTGKQLAELKSQQRYIWSVDFSPDGTQLATGGNDGTARLWDTTGKQLAELKSHQGRVENVVFSPDGTQLATSGDDGIVRLWDFSGNRLVELKGHQGSVISVVFSPDGTQLATRGGDGTARLWDISGKQLAQLKGDQRNLTSVVFSPNGQQLATAGGTAWLWDISGNPLVELKGHQGGIWSVVFSPNGQQLATAGDENTVYLWDTAGKQLAQLKGDQGALTSVVFSPNGQQLATSGEDGTAQLWDSAGKQLVKLKGDQGALTSVVFSPNGQQLATSGEDGAAQLWDTAGNQLAELKGYQGTVTSVVFSPNGQQLATSGKDGTARLWDTAGKQLAELKGHEGALTSVVFSPNGQQLATSGEDGTARLWDTAGKQLAELKGAQETLTSVVFSPNGQQLVTNGASGTVRLWDTTGKPLAELKGSRGESNYIMVGSNTRVIGSAVFSPDGTQLVTSGADGPTRLWLIGGVDELLAKNCDWVRGFLQNAPSTEKDQHLCDGIGTIPQANPSPAISPPATPFSAAVNQATSAAKLAQTAKTPEQWRTVAIHWQQAITHLQSIPPTDPNHTTAQQKIGEYQKNLQYAQQRKATAK